jgi:hypothetical protein
MITDKHSTQQCSLTVCSVSTTTNNDHDLCRDRVHDGHSEYSRPIVYVKRMTLKEIECFLPTSCHTRMKSFEIDIIMFENDLTFAS